MSIERLSTDGGETVVLRRFRDDFVVPEPTGASPAADHLVRTGVVLDCETTGLNPPEDRVISVGLRQFQFRRDTGALAAAGARYYGLEDPGIPIPERVTRITGLTDDDVRGRAIDWALVARLIDESDVVIAHNARFDRAFIDDRIGGPRKAWLCSLDLLDWRGYGFPTASLEVLCVWHGFFVSSHDAMEDADCLLHLLSHREPGGEATYLGRLLAVGRQPTSRVWAQGSPYESRHALKDRGYRWDPRRRAFWRDIPTEAEGAEEEWLADSVYEGACLAAMERISVFDRYRFDEQEGLD